MTAQHVTDEEVAAWVQQAWAAGDAARAEHLRRCAVRLARLVRQHFPGAATVTVDLTDCMPRGDVRPSLVRIGEPAGAVWDWDDPDIEWRLTLPETREIEELLFDALAFDVTHQVLAEAGWQQAEHDHEQYTLPLPAVEVPAARVPVVWLLHHDDDARTTGEVTVHPSEQAGVAHLAPKVRESWHRVAGEPGVPEVPPADDAQAVRVYFDAREGEDGYSLYPVEVPGLVLPPLEGAGG
ncbi:hypothetical protein F5972_08460 [Microbispora cellulosiformans]|uniref:Uncharacterized protein n=1 Tax=Microbispora cellulosiformans TaxID=2614688 RepID=A0A5J5K7K6_9ACTN|nr:hypothetical protein [Microbispora cellulosiformans]KAA9379674.1 hypothetical protein F5972_08460 [Microbispora cellulosiformans]